MAEVMSTESTTVVILNSRESMYLSQVMSDWYQDSYLRSKMPDGTIDPLYAVINNVLSELFYAFEVDRPN
jgi:hypothetical protein